MYSKMMRDCVALPPGTATGQHVTSPKPTTAAQSSAVSELTSQATLIGICGAVNLPVRGIN